MARGARKLGYEWHLRELMAERGMFQTTELAAPLAERGVALSPAQIHRLVTQTPERLNLHVLVALCDVLDCVPGDLIEPVKAAPQRKRATTATRPDSTPAPREIKPRRARIVREER